MEARRKIVYEFEHAETLECLKSKILLRTRDGWRTSGAPREVPVRISDAGFDLCYCQTFYRYSDEPISREPWLNRAG